MKTIKQAEIVFSKEAPFENCQLGREQYASVLTNIVETYKDGFVLAINNKWGTGKTTFVKMWEQQLKNEDFKTLYFNAWENDIEKNALVAILAELKKFSGNGGSKSFDDLLKKGAIIAKNIIPGIIKALADKYVQSQQLSEILENVSRAGVEVLKHDIDNYTDRKENLKKFKAELAQFAHEISADKPLVFFVDELDRCNPNYAVEVLEHIKHFFSVNGIVFVLSIDKTQLSHAIGGFYGNSEIDSAEYLRRFIDIEYSIPEPNFEEYTKYLYHYYSFGNFFEHQERGQHPDLQIDGKNFINIAYRLFEHSNTTLRQQEKIFALARITLNTFTHNQFVLPEVLMYLVFIKLYKPGLYVRIQKKELNHQSLLDEFVRSIPNVETYENIAYHPFIYLQSDLLVMYNASLQLSKVDLIDYEEQIALFESGLDLNGDKTFYNCLKQRLSRREARIEIDYLLKKIDLIEPLIS